MSWSQWSILLALSAGAALLVAACRPRPQSLILG